MAKDLAMRYKEPVKWNNILEFLCVKTIQEFELGEPVREIWTSDDIAPPEWLLKPILYRGLPTILFGEKAVCKTILALVTNICLVLPWQDNPLGWTAPQRPIRTLLADYENEYDVAHYNFKRLQRGMGLPPMPLLYRHCILPLADDIEQLQAHIADKDIEVLIVDSLGPAVGGELKESAPALRFAAALRRLHCSTLIIGQTSKDKEAKVRSTYGSTFFEYLSRNVWELRKVQEEGEDSLDIAMYNTYHNLGPKFRPMGYHVSFTETETHIEKGAITARELVARIGTGEQIRQLLLKQGAMTVKDIIDKLELSNNAVRLSISRLTKKGIIQRVGEGYGVAIQKEYVV